MTGLIELKLNDLNQLFNSMDPSPFHERDLDHNAEEFIVSRAMEHALESRCGDRSRSTSTAGGPS